MSNLKIGYPAIPFRAVEIVTPSALSEYSSTYNVIGNPPWASFTVSTFDITTLSFDLGSGVTEAVDFLYFNRANATAGGAEGLTVRRMSQMADYPKRLFGTRLAAWWHANVQCLNFVSSLRITSWKDNSRFGLHADQATDADRPYLTRNDNRSNWIWSSENFDDTSVWTATRASVTGGALSEIPLTTSSPGYHPDISFPEKLVEDTSVAATHLVAQSVNTQKNGETYIFSVYAKAAERSKLRLLLSGTSFPATPESTFTLSGGGTTGGTIGCTPTITLIGNGWYRCSISVACTVNGNCQTIFYLDNGAGPTYTGDGASGLYLWGAQFAESDADSTYVYNWSGLLSQTRKFAGINGNRAVRFTDSDVLTASKDLKIDGDFAIFAVVKLRATTDAGTNYTILSDEVLNASGIMLRLNGSPGPTHQVFLRTNQAGANTTLTSSQSIAINTPTIISVVFSAGTATIYKNGVSIGSGAVTAPVQIATGALSLSLGSAPFQGEIGEVIVVNGTVTGGEHTNMITYLTEQWITAPVLNKTDLRLETFVGPSGNDYIDTTISGAASRYWWFQVHKTRDPAREGGSSTSLYTLAFGSAIDPGVEFMDSDLEMIVGAGQSFESSGGDLYLTRNRIPFRRIRVDWRGVTDAIAKTIQDRIVKYIPEIPIILFTTTYHEALENLKAIMISAKKIEAIKEEVKDYNTITIEGDEIR